MSRYSVDRRAVIAFLAAALIVSVAWIGEANQARAASSTPVVYIATGENFPDALGAGPAAAIVKGPILLVSQNAIPGETAAELTRLAPDKIIIVGGTAVVSPDVENGLKAYAPTVERVAGTNRYDTAAKLSATMFPATIDADTLNGLNASAFLGKTDTAADADLLDGKDSSAFVEHGEIVMTTSGNAWLAHGAYADTTEYERWATETVFFTPVRTVISLNGPAAIGGVDYGLASFDLCVITGSNFVSAVSVTGIAAFGADVDDDQYLELFSQVFPKPGLTTGCHTFEVNAPVGNGAGVMVEITDISDYSPVTLSSVRSVWTPEAAQA